MMGSTSDTGKKPRKAFHNHEINPDDPRFKLHDIEAPTSIYSLVPECLKSIILEVYERMPKLLMRDERTIRDYVKPTEREDRVRLAFWDEYNRCSSTTVPKKMAVKAFLGQTASLQMLQQEYGTNRAKVLWLITPVKNYSHSMQLILNRSMDKLLDVVNREIVNPDGTLDHKLISQIIKIAQITDLRVKGAIPQYLRVDQRSMNVNVDADQARLQRVSTDFEQLLNMPLDDLEKLQIKAELLAERSSLLPGASIIEAELAADVENKDEYMLNNSPLDLNA